MATRKVYILTDSLAAVSKTTEQEKQRYINNFINRFGSNPTLSMDCDDCTIYKRAKKSGKWRNFGSLSYLRNHAPSIELYSDSDYKNRRKSTLVRYRNHYLEKVFDKNNYILLEIDTMMDAKKALEATNWDTLFVIYGVKGV